MYLNKIDFAGQKYQTTLKILHIRHTIIFEYLIKWNIPMLNTLSAIRNIFLLVLLNATFYSPIF